MSSCGSTDDEELSFDYRRNKQGSDNVGTSTNLMEVSFFSHFVKLNNMMLYSFLVHLMLACLELGESLLLFNIWKLLVRFCPSQS